MQTVVRSVWHNGLARVNEEISAWHNVFGIVRIVFDGFFPNRDLRPIRVLMVFEVVVGPMNQIQGTRPGSCGADAGLTSGGVLAGAPSWEAPGRLLGKLLGSSCRITRLLTRKESEIIAGWYPAGISTFERHDVPRRTWKLVGVCRHTSKDVY